MVNSVSHPLFVNGPPLRHHVLDPREAEIVVRSGSGRDFVVAAFDGGSMTPDTGLLLRRLDPRTSLLLRLRIPPQPVGLVTRPVVYQDTPALEQVGVGIGCLDLVLEYMRQGHLDQLRGWSVSSAAQSRKLDLDRALQSLRSSAYLSRSL